MAYTTSQITDFATLTAANADLKAKVWSQKVRRGARQKNALREFIGSPDSGSPIIENTDLSKGAAGDTVVFTSVASERSQGTLGENDLRVRTGRLTPGTMSVVVDILKHAVSWSDKFRLMTVAGKSVDVITSDVMEEWLGRKEEDDLQMTALRTCRLLSPTTNLYQVGGSTSLEALKSTDTLTTTLIEEVKGWMGAIGGKELSIQKEASGAESLRYLFFGPDRVLRPLRSSAAYQQTILNADARGKDNRLFTGEYGIWDNTVVYPHNIKIDEAAGRQGSPLVPFAKLGTALADGSATTITGGGGSVDPANALGDFFANFPGFLWKITDGEVPPADSGPHYAMIYNVTDGKYEIFSYTTGNNGNTITGVTRGTAANFPGNVTANGVSRFSNVHPVGSFIFPCTSKGVPYGYGLVLGADALAYAKGAYDAQKIMNYEGFQPAGGGEPELKSFGLRSIRGMAAYKNAAGAHNGVIAVRAAIKIPGITGPEAVTA